MTTRISKLATQNYKNLWLAEGLPLQALNLFIGPNGSGKSNLLNVLRFLKDATTAPADESRGVTGFEDAVFKLGGHKILDASVESPAKVSFNYEFSSPDMDRDIYFGLSLLVQGKRVSVTGEQLNAPHRAKPPILYYRGEDNTVRFLPDNDKIAPLQPPENDLVLVKMPTPRENGKVSPEELVTYKVRNQLLETMAQWRFYNANDMNLGEIRRSEPKLGPSDKFVSASGNNLSLVLHNLTQESLDFEERINNAMRAVLPTTRRVRAVASGRLSVTTEWHFADVKTPFYLDEMSDGTVRMLCWASILHSPLLPSLLVIEEPEIGLHVAWLRVLAEWIKAASQKTQIIISTHSPDLLDYFTDRVDSVYVFHAAEGDQAHFAVKQLSQAMVAPWLEDGWQLGDLYRVGDPSIGGWPW
ncbi:MAG TPA: AAA family ATPase [Anaerolineae bacterium]|nr:AAA family ATPase [Anaerolineae bacterium]HQK15593.1 AAA family ATPase [Anaerolineae bacterium]